MSEPFLREVLEVQSGPQDDRLMRVFIQAELMKQPGVTITQTFGNIYATKGVPDAGSFYPCYVCHMDTVHQIISSRQFKVAEDKGHLYAYNPVFGGYEGIGGDDKVGVYLALECMRDLPVCKAVFFRDEEMGCAGSKHANISFFDDCSFVLQGDRKGGEDFISRSAGEWLHGEDFAAAIDPILRAREFSDCQFGGLSDVVQLRRKGLAIASANVSCGYYNPHTNEEFVVVSDVMRALDLFLDAGELLASWQWVYPWVAPPVIVTPTLTGIVTPAFTAKSLDAISDAIWAQALARRRALNYEQLTLLNASTTSGTCPICKTEKAVSWDLGDADYACSICKEFVATMLANQLPELHA